MFGFTKHLRYCKTIDYWKEGSGMKIKLVSLLVLYMFVGTMVPIVGLSGDAGDSLNAVPDDMLIWEAYAKGDVRVKTLSDNRFIVSNDGSHNVLIEEHVQILNPNPLDLAPQVTTQDGALVPTYTIPPSGAITYNVYIPGVPNPSPYWWCTEEKQYTKEDVEVTLGGEIMPYVMQDILDEQSLGNIQNEIWAYQRENPALVIGKTPLWKRIPDNQENEIDVQLAVTNTGFQQATSALVIDSILPGYSYDPNSFSLQPDSISIDMAGNTIFRWHISLDAAPWIELPTTEPTLYDYELISYRIKTPILSEGKHFLPRAFVDQDDDINNDAESARPVLEVYHVNSPPVANAGGFYYVQEGSTVTFDASASFDPEGDPLQFRWDLDSDGVWDTGWSVNPTVSLVQGDDVSGMVKLEVTDGQDSSVDFAYYIYENVAPTVVSLDYVVTVSAPRTIGYWGRQCWDWLPPSPDHLGILPEYVQFIASSSQVFDSVQTKDDVCTQLEDVIHSDMKDKAEQQLMGLWLNVASGNLSFGTQVYLPELNYTGSVGDFIEWAETVILNSVHDDMETVKDIADYINNGIGVEIATVTFTASATDPGSDDLSFEWDFGDGTGHGPEWVYNNGASPEPEDTPTPDGTYPFSASNIVSRGYVGLGSYTILLTVVDDDIGETTQSIDIIIG